MFVVMITYSLTFIKFFILLVEIPLDPKPFLLGLYLKDQK